MMLRQASSKLAQGARCMSTAKDVAFGTDARGRMLAGGKFCYTSNLVVYTLITRELQLK